MAELFQDLGKTFASVLSIVGVDIEEESAENTNGSSARRALGGSHKPLLPPPPQIRLQPRRVRSTYAQVMVSGRSFGDDTVEVVENADADQDEDKDDAVLDQQSETDRLQAQEEGTTEGAGEEKGSDEIGQSQEPAIEEEMPQTTRSSSYYLGNEESHGGRTPEMERQISAALEAEEGWMAKMKPTRRRLSAEETGARARQGKLVWDGHQWIPMTLELFKGAKFVKAVDKKSENFYYSCKEKGITVWEEPIKVLLHEALHQISRKNYSEAKEIAHHIVEKTKAHSETHERAKMAVHECDRHAGVFRTHIENKTTYDYTANEYSDVWDGKQWHAQTLDWCLDGTWEKGEAHGKPYWSAHELNGGVTTWYDPKCFVCDKAIGLMEAKEFWKAKELFDIAKLRCEPGERLPGRIRTEIRTNNWMLGLENDMEDAHSAAAGSSKSLVGDQWPFPKPQRVDDTWNGEAWVPMSVETAMTEGWEVGKDQVIKEKYYSNKKAGVVTWTNPREFLYEEGKKLWKKKKYDEARSLFLQVEALTNRMGGGTYEATPLYLAKISERLDDMEKTKRHQTRRDAGMDSESEESQPRAGAGRRGSQVSAASELGMLHPGQLPRWLKPSDYWDGQQWNRMNRLVALTGEWVARVDPGANKVYWTNTESKFFTWRKPPPEKWFNYNEAKLLFKLRRYKQCKRKLQSYNDPEYHYTEQYLDICELHIQDARRRQEAETVYADGKALYERGKFEEAHHCFEVVDVLAKGQKFHHAAKYREICKRHMEKRRNKEEQQRVVESRKTASYFSHKNLRGSATQDHKQRSKALLANATRWEPQEQDKPSQTMLPPPPHLLQSLFGAVDDEDDDDDDDDDEGEGIEWEWEYEDEEEGTQPDAISQPPSLPRIVWPWESVQSAPSTSMASKA